MSKAVVFGCVFKRCQFPNNAIAQKCRTQSFYVYHDCVNALNIEFLKVSFQYSFIVCNKGVYFCTKEQSFSIKPSPVTNSVIQVLNAGVNISPVVLSVDRLVMAGCLGAVHALGCCALARV